MASASRSSRMAATSGSIHATALNTTDRLPGMAVAFRWRLALSARKRGRGRVGTGAQRNVASPAALDRASRKTGHARLHIDGQDLADLLSNAQEAVWLWAKDALESGEGLPKPRGIEVIRKDPDVARDLAAVRRLRSCRW